MELENNALWATGSRGSGSSGSPDTFKPIGSELLVSAVWLVNLGYSIKHILFKYQAGCELMKRFD